MNPRSSHVFRLSFRSISHFALRKLIKFSSKLFIDSGKGATRSLEEFEIMRSYRMVDSSYSSDFR